MPLLAHVGALLHCKATMRDRQKPKQIAPCQQAYYTTTLFSSKTTYGMALAHDKQITYA